MSAPGPKRYLTIPRFDRIPWLVHGFGLRDWALRDFQTVEAWKNFKVVWLDQVHRNTIRLIDKIPRRRLRGDALVTRLPEVFLIIKTADCLPIFLIDESKRVVAGVHCGWRSTEKRMAQCAVRAMEENYGCRPADLLAGLGPSIGAACYEVGEEVVRAFECAGHPPDCFRPHPRSRGKYFLDLALANRRQLEAEGVRPKNIISLDVCTHCDSRLLSYRRDSDKKARLLNFIGVKATHCAPA